MVLGIVFRIMKQLFFAIILITTLSCKKDEKQNEFIEGNIYIKLIDVNNMLYGLPKEDIENFKRDSYSQVNIDNTESERKFIEYQKILIDNNLVQQSHFKLKTNDNKIINVYTNENEYTKLSKHLNDLNREKEKIIVKFEGVKISEGVIDEDNIFNKAIYKAKKIISVIKLAGKTDWDK